jgi:hypothetical protein
MQDFPDDLLGGPTYSPLPSVSTKEETMSRKRIATISVAGALAVASAGVGAGPTAAAPQNASPGACHMFNVFNSAVGFAGMAHAANGQGLQNMESLLAASGCLP